MAKDEVKDVERSLPAAEAAVEVSAVEELYLTRLAELVARRDQGDGAGDAYLRKVLDRAIYAVWRECGELGLKEKADAIVNRGQE